MYSDSETKQMAIREWGVIQSEQPIQSCMQNAMRVIICQLWKKKIPQYIFTPAV